MILGISLSFVAYLRGMEPNTVGTFNIYLDPEVKPEDVRLCKFPPRKLRMEILVDNRVTLYIYLVDIRTNDIKRIILRDENVTRKVYDIQIPVRGFYKIMVRSLGQPVYGEIYIMLYGLEKDLLQTSIGLVAVSIVTAMIQYLIVRLKMHQSRKNY